ncbi:MAG: LPS export ABC transporter periplasmic protein LptC [Bdellovibrionota bacterium]
MPRWKNILFFSLLILLFIEILIIFPNQLEKKTEGKSTADALPGGPQQKMEGVHLVESQKGSRDWELFAEKAIGTQDQGTWNLKKVKVQYYNKEHVDYIVVGDQGVIEGKNKDMRVSGHVVTRSANGYVFTTETVSYEAGKRKISSPSRIQMTGPKDSEGSGLTLTGEKMTVLVDENLMHIEEKVFAQRQMKDNKILMIKSGQAQFSGKNNEARFTENVQIKYGDLIIYGPEANFVYNPGSQFLDSIQVKGGIKVTGQDKVVTSENLNIDLTKNLFRFLGRPKVIQNEDELTGEEILFLDGGKQVKVQKVKARVESQK